MLKKVKSGFSLVELSLVLIIVALIISAVVSGKSLVQNSKLTMLHSEMQTLKIALGNYINDNQKTSFEVGKDIILFDLMNDGYLEDGAVTDYDGTSLASSGGSAKNKLSIFKSKYSGGAWQYAGTSDNIIVKFGKVDSSNGSITDLLPGGMARTFQTKYEKAGSIMMNDKDSANEGHGKKYDGGTTPVVLTVYFLDGAQN